MAELDPDSPRLDALFRVLLLILYVPTVWLVVVVVGGIAGLIFMITDVLIQFIWGNSGISPSRSSMLTKWAERLFFWPLEQLKYIIGTDTTGFPVLP